MAIHRVLLKALLMGFFSMALILVGPSRLFSATATLSGYIIGRVLDAEERRPIANAELNIVGTDWYTVSDDSGDFAFVDVPPGDYLVHASAFNYFAQTLSLSVPDEQVGYVNFLLRRRAYLPMAVTVFPSGPDAHIQWTLQRPQTNLRVHNDHPISGWFQKWNKAYGVVFDLSEYAQATLEQMDFNHYAWQILHGPYRYRIHVFDWQDSTTVTTIDGITSQDSYSSPQWEVAIDLRGLSGLTKVGLFVEPLSGTVDDAHPVISTDNDVPAREGVNYIIEDLSRPFSSLVESRSKNSGYGNFLIDLWINHNGKIQRLTQQNQPSVSAFTPAALTRGVIPAGLTSARPIWPHPLSLHGFSVYRNLTEKPGMITRLAELSAESFSFVDANAPQDSSYTYGVSARYDSLESSIVLVRYFHPPVLTLAQAVEDEASPGYPDRIGQRVTVKGVVSTPNFSGRSRLDFYLQDDLAGLHVFSATESLAVVPGQELYLSGEITTIGGLTTLAITQPQSMKILKTNAELTVKSVTKDEWSKSIESQLIKMSGFVLIDPSQWPAAGQNGLVEMSDGRDTVLVLIDHSTDIDGSPAPSGSFSVIGVLDRTAATGWVLRPRWLRDFIATVGVVQSVQERPIQYTLGQNYPNPFNSTTLIQISLPTAEKVNLAIYDLLGREVMAVYSGRLAAGVHRFRVDGAALGSGLYFYRLQTPTFHAGKKMIVME